MDYSKLKEDAARNDFICVASYLFDEDGGFGFVLLFGDFHVLGFTDSEDHPINPNLKRLAINPYQ